MHGQADQRGNRAAPSLLMFAVFFVALLILHLPLLRLPYFWDEAGYYIPAARDLLLHGTLIPHSTPSNAHPPLVMMYLALIWKALGYAPAVTRTGILAIAAFSLLGIFRLTQRVANTQVAAASAACTAVYPVFFTQSSLAHLDLAAAGLTFWGLLAYVENRRWATVIWFTMAALAKETAILAPLALFGWELVRAFDFRKSNSPDQRGNLRPSSPVRLLLPIIPLTVWYAFHYARTGFVFGNPEFFRYNVQDTLQPLRFVLALGLRLWQVVGYLHLSVLTLAGLLAMWLPPLHDNGEERKRISLDVQFSFLAIISAYVVAMAVVGGAELARYMLPAVPLVIILFVSTLRRRMRLWRGMVAIVVVAFTVALFVNPPYGFSMEDNLAYRDYILLHERAESFLQSRYPSARVLTAWPASDELAGPFLGYVARPMRVLRIEDFTAEQMIFASGQRSGFDVALVFSTKYEPPHPWFQRWSTWQQWKTRFFGYHRDVPPAVAAEILGGRVVYSDVRNRQWIAVIETEQVEEAKFGGPEGQMRQKVCINRFWPKSCQAPEPANFRQTHDSTPEIDLKEWHIYPLGFGSLKIERRN